MKYYAAILNIQHGEYEHNQTVFFKLENGEDPDKYHEDLAATFYQDDEDQPREERKESCGYWHNGEMIISCGNIKEIDKHIYDALVYL